MVNVKPTAGVAYMPVEYNDIIKSIKLVLKNRYKMTANEADAAILLSPIKQIFDTDMEMAAHTSNEAWAREIYRFWKNSKE